MATNYYDLLGVARDAGDKEIRQAYRRLARQYHPDVNPGDTQAEEKFKEINAAHEVLSDGEKRRKYDKYGDRWMQADRIEEAEAQARSRGGGFSFYTAGDFNPAAGGFDFDLGDLLRGSSNQDLLNRTVNSPGFSNQDILSGMFGSERRGRSRPPAEYPVEVTLAEAAEGATRLITLPDERRLEVKIPPGVTNGSRVHIPAGGSSGGGRDFYLNVTVMAHPRFERQGKDLYAEIAVPLTDLALGAEVTVPTLRSKVALTIPPGTQNGRRFRLAGQGMPELNQPESKGSLYATVKAVLPTNLTPEELALFRQLKELRPDRSE